MTVKSLIKTFSLAAGLVTAALTDAKAQNLAPVEKDTTVQINGKAVTIDTSLRSPRYKMVKVASTLSHDYSLTFRDPIEGHLMEIDVHDQTGKSKIGWKDVTSTTLTEQIPAEKRALKLMIQWADSKPLYSSQEDVRSTADLVRYAKLTSSGDFISSAETEGEYVRREFRAAHLTR